MKGLLAGILLGAVLTSAGPSLSHPHESHTNRPCYEDEAIFWTGDDHDKCIALDDLVVHPTYFNSVANGICHHAWGANRWYGVTRMPEGCDGG